MKFAGPFISACVFAAFIPATVSAGDLAMAANPYTTISERNVFALVPIPVVTNVVDTAPKDPPPKITPNGIISLFGKLEVLFKVAVKPAAGQPAKDASYVMGEGERQDEIEVVKIDQAGEKITFRNHGDLQELMLAEAPKITTPASSSGGVGTVPVPVGKTSALGGISGAMAKARAAAAGRSSGGSAPTEVAPDISANAGTAATAEPKTIEDKVIKAAAEIAQIELNRIDTQDLVDQGKLPPLPPTLLTPTEALDKLVTTPDSLAAPNPAATSKK